MADGILWHLGAGVFFAWLAFHFLWNRRRAEELEGGFVALVSWEGEPPRALVLRALRFLEAECFDVLGTPIRLEQPSSGDAPRAAAALLGRLNRLRRGAPQDSPGRARLEAVFVVGEGNASHTHASRGQRLARWNGSQWELP